MNGNSMVTTTFLLLVAVGLSTTSAIAGNSIENSTQATGRSGRKDYDVVYTPPDNYPPKKSGNFFTAEDVLKREDDATPGFEPSQPKEDSQQQQPPEPVYYPPTYYDEYVPVSYYKPRPRYYTDDPMYKSGTSVNWNVWKGDSAQPPAQPPQPSNTKGGGPPPPDFTEYFMTDDAWKGDPWTPDQMASMMAMMNQMQTRPKLGGLLSKLTQDPGLLLMAAILPLSMILAAVLPTLVNMAMNGGIPTVTTTATGNTNGRSLDSTEFLSPVLQTITTFGARTFDNPDCMQRIFCQVTRGPPVNGTESRSFQKALYSASRLIDNNWLEDFGVKTLFDSMGDGDCDKIPCSTQGSPRPKSGDKSKKS